METKFIPKGSMCAACVKSKTNNFCNKLDFKSMRIMKKKDNEGFVIVKCDEFKKEVTAK